MEEDKIKELWLWLGNNHEKGVTNKEMVAEFGEGYKIAWNKTKRRYAVENGLFYENGRWYRWFGNN